MSRTTHEIQRTLTNLHIILHRNTTPDGIYHRPYGTDWVAFFHNFRRLLILRGLITHADRLPMDPWEMFLDEYAPRRPEPEASEGAVQNVAAVASSSSSSSSSSYPAGILSAI
ncbi:hypothetical protein BO78DRAFT_415014 [Aspergillus sclerotiicarbonarius CBS 121057]|uniref:Uncharacterized protein n=1 Tax=Aspergillus sclerotiicarbonarius (strain CBS 121057 / IBT 28362) TaxID=1448318 RepID=A0A319EKP9_ASPSB|nr:hypothetical protein BO78DRAFT_415014 [Aspergillus sclerotiicarbonarius CBS 121057]